MFSPAGKAAPKSFPRKPMTPTRQNVNGSLMDSFYSEAKSSSLGSFGSMLMDAAKDADEERDSIHARRIAKQQDMSAEKKRRAAEDEGAKLASRLEEEENDKILAARLLQEEREYEEIMEQNRQRQAEADGKHAEAVAKELQEAIGAEEKEVEAADAQLAQKLLREEKDALMAERIIESDRMAMRAQKKLEEEDFEKARLLHAHLEGERKREEGEIEGRDRMVARSYEIKDQRTHHRETRKSIWLDKIAALHLWAEENTQSEKRSEEKKGDDDDDDAYAYVDKRSSDFMSMDEFKMCHDFTAWQDASMEIHDVMAGICVSARLPNLSEVDFVVGESGKEVELHCTSHKKPGHEVRLIHKNIEAYYGLMNVFKRSIGADVSENDKGGCDIDPVSTYSIHLQLDACLGVGVTKKDISYVYCDASGVLFVYLNGLKLRGSPTNTEKKEGEKPIDKSNSLFKRMVSKISWRNKK
jgi:hypothetical protein